MKKHILSIKILLIEAAVFTNIAPASNSSHYAIDIDGITNGGRQTESASYNMTSSIGGIGGLGSNVSPDIIARSGFPGQLFEIDSVDVLAIPGSINEGESSQLSATVHLDDETVLLPASTLVQWSKISGPVNTPSSAGSVTSQVVYENSIATLGGTYGGMLGTSLLAILDSNHDNYSSYGSDNIDDDWQVSYFGEPPNSDAGPSENPDGDVDDNEMEFLTGFDPTDPTQWFQLIISDKTGSIASLQLNKVIPGRTYTIQAGTDLLSFPDMIITLNPSTEEFDKVVTDTNFTGQKKFYRVDVTKP